MQSLREVLLALKMPLNAMHERACVSLRPRQQHNGQRPQQFYVPTAMMFVCLEWLKTADLTSLGW